MKRIGIDVGGTNTDAVLVDGKDVLAACKTPTTEDVTGGIRQALRDLLAIAGDQAADVVAVMIGTTHFVNAVVQRRDLNRAAALRVCLPASASLPPFVDWPKDLADAVNGGVYLVAGGHEYDGRPLAELDECAVAEAARQIKCDGIASVAVSAVFSPLTSEAEDRAVAILRQEHPDAVVTKSSALGRIGLLERENAALLNASLADLAARTTDAFEEALRESGLHCPLYITQNDGTVAVAEMARAYPVYSFASGPTNSMRGAVFLSGIEEAMVCDIGGTTADIGCLKHGFPREANNVVEIGGVRTLFRMPDVYSIGLGGGSLVTTDPITVGPRSVGYKLTEQALVFGGDTLTCTDVAVAAGLAEIGDAHRVAHLSKEFVEQVRRNIDDQLYDAVDGMKTDADPLPLLAVGGGAILAPDRMEGITEVVRVDHHDVANAVGAAIAQISGEVDRIFNDMSRDDILAAATAIAQDNALAAGADKNSLKVVEMEDLPLAYLPGNAVRARVRVVGDVRAL